MARQRWERALRADPDFELALKNLEDLARPAAERHGAWAFRIDRWWAGARWNEFRALMESDRELTVESLRMFHSRFPDLPDMLAWLLKRGAPDDRATARILAERLEMTEVLANYARGQDGPLKSRMEAAQASGLRGSLRMWDGEKYVQAMLMEIHEEPGVLHSPSTTAIVREALMLMREERFIEAERLFGRIPEAEAAAPDIRFNLANCLLGLGRDDAAVAMLDALVREHPDDPFAMASRALSHALQHEFTQAQGLLDRVMALPRIHKSALVTSYDVQIRVHLLQHRYDLAGQCLDVLRSFAPEDPTVQYWQPRLEKAGHWQTVLDAFAALAKKTVSRVSAGRVSAR